MSFNSLVFLVYLVIVLLLYYVLPHKFRWAMLLVASYVFYAYWNFNLIFLIVGSTLVAYLSAILIEQTDKVAVKRLWLIVTLCVSLGMLLFFKYFNFFSGSVTSLMRLFGLEVDDFFLNLILPVGISFYTFQTLSYVIDVYRGTFKAERHLGYFALFVSFFPQLVAGPIERPQDLLPQLKAEHKFDWNNLEQGFKLFVSGFVKKVVIADTLAVYVNAVYNSADIGGVTGLAVFIATFIFVFQIFCDFSGYSDIATGCAKMMGIDLTLNFKSPLSSDNFEMLWNNWHITLNSWFRDYVYMPLNYRAMGKKHMEVRVYVNLFIVFLVSGLWHGANWTFVLWGVYNGIIQIVAKLLQKPKNKLYKKLGWQKRNPKTKWLRVIFVNFVMALGLLIFRSNNVDNMFVFFGKLFSDWSFAPEYFANTFSLLGMDVMGAITVVILATLTVFLDKFIVEPRGKEIAGVWEKNGCMYVYFIWLIAIAWLLLISQGQSSGFIYFQF